MHPSRIPWGLRGAARLLPLLALCCAPALAEEAAAPRARWYETLREGQKIGWTQVVWTASTWQGRPTVHDRTESRTRSARDMAGHLDVFETRTVIDLERDEDGTLWWQRIEVTEAGRRSSFETTWTGAGYEHVTRVADQEERVTIALDAPVHTDAEALVSARARAGTLAPGTLLSLRSLDVPGRKAHLSPVQVVGPEPVEAEEGVVPATKLIVRHPETRSEDLLWIDAEGAFVRSQGEGGVVQRRVSEATARRLPARAPSFGITVPSRPPLARVMSADRHWVEIELRADPERRLPELPASPWGRIGTPVERAGGWSIPAELRAYDAPGVTRPLPLPRAGFERELEPTALMPCGHPDLQAAAREAVGDAADARTAAARLARWVHDVLEKESAEVAQASALQILEERRGDCSEHALLFVALCRTLGIPARLCSGYVNIGPMWGAHAWAEIWVGAWMGADPTTGEIGTAARYLFFGYQDMPDSWPGVVSARVQGRIQIRTLAVEEDGVRWDLGHEPAQWVAQGPGPGGWWAHLPTGLDARGLPEGWSATSRDASRVELEGPGLRASLWAQADQGDDLSGIGGAPTTFAEAPAVTFERGGRRIWVVHSRRRLVRVVLQAEADLDAASQALQRVLGASFAPQASDPRVPPSDGPRAHGAWALDVEATRAHLEAGLPAGLAPDARRQLAERVERALGRYAVQLLLKEDGAYGLALTRREDPPDGARGRVTFTLDSSSGRWSAGPGGPVLEPQEGGEAPELAFRGARLLLSWAGRTWLLAREQGAAGR